MSLDTQNVLEISIKIDKFIFTDGKKTHQYLCHLAHVKKELWWCNEHMVMIISISFLVK